MKISELVIDENNNPIFKLSIEAQLIYKLLKECQIGDVITYQEINELIGRDIQKRLNVLYTARKIARKYDNFIFDCIINVGIKRINSKEILGKESTQTLKRIVSTTKNSVKNMNCIDYATLDNDERYRLNCTRSLMVVISETAKQKTLESMQKDAAYVTPKVITTEKLLEFFKYN
jgi:hypothetical protein